MSYVWFQGAVVLVGLGLGFASTGCHRSRQSASDSSSSTQAESNTAIDRQALSRTDILLDIARMPHAEVTTRLGAHRIESHTHYTITPLPPTKPVPAPPDVTPGFREGQPAHPFEGAAAFESQPVSLDETRYITVDATGALQLSSANDHGYGVEASLVHDYLYLRMRNGPYIRHRPEGDELERLRGLAYESGAALLEAVAPFVYLSTPSETTRLGRPAWQVTLSRQQGKKRAEAQPVPVYRAWRGALEVDSLDGYAVVDRQRGTLLELKLQVRFVAPRGKPVPGTPAPADGERVQVAAEHELHAVALGKEVVKIQPPTEWNEPPTRSRPTLEKQELLNGLVPARP